ncbi:MAG: M14 family metallopeptidase [Negativicutes bacterium]|nr:M14 family metallopeptidase [Negativicutes bacterium]
MQLMTPKEFLGFEPGSDRTLADWPQMLAYFEHLAAASERVKLTEMGKSTEGKPFINLIISSEYNMKHLETHRQNQARLADPRGLSDEDARELIRIGKTIVMISCGIHSTEIAGPEYSMALAYSLAAATMPNAEQILDNVILVLVPSLNPDGHQMITEWYRKNLDTPYEGGVMPWLYQKYVGHDNNRDWYTFSQVENRLTVEEIHNQWHPQIIYDMHQMGTTAARFFIPPYVDPIEPNVDPIIQQEIVWIGSAMAQELTAQDKKGVLIHGIYDAWNPARAFQHTHGGIRILTEAASCKIATPVSVKFEELSTGIGYDGKVRAWNFPEPWTGGEWHLSDIIEYERLATEALLTHAARNRETWLRNFLQIGRKAVNRQGAPYAFVIPAGQRATDSVYRLLRIFQIGQVELYTADQPFSFNGKTYAAGSVIIPAGQPYFAFAKCLLEVQDYPDIREYPGGPPQRPYDVTAFTQGLLMGIDTVTVTEPLSVRMTRLSDVTPKAAAAPRSDASCYIVDPKLNDGFAFVNDLLQNGFKVERLTKTIETKEAVLPAGLWVIPTQVGLARLMQDWAEKGLVITPWENGLPTCSLRPVRFGLYKSWTGEMDEGWLRFVLEQFHFDFESPGNELIQAGNLIEKYDALILPNMPVQRIQEGLPESMVPAPYFGGLGEAGAAALKDFVQAGGVLIAIDHAVDYAIETLGIPARNILAKLPPKDFYIPGSLLRVFVNNEHPVTWGAEKAEPIWFQRSGALAVDSGTVLAHYPSSNLLLSGWMLDPQAQLNGRSALCEIPMGKGRIVCFAFNPIYRAQAHNTYKLIFNAILSAGIK